ncbi:hypothetical protein BV25DRAFT_1842945 [Artomyces pyxidatus]|uniref:Uncharacterized protein n=1 Tax=Artomyces pyxidatus TaxID=48021 RepID=A0ACB8SI41_9AGAM|nr:hypothetical protein BV25DRAFT_1842945 [Artomyces pyxidatus]
MDAWRQVDAERLLSAPEASAATNAIFYYGNVPYYTHWQSYPDNNILQTFDYGAMYDQELMLEQAVGVGIPYDSSIFDVERACNALLSLHTEETPCNNRQHQTPLLGVGIGIPYRDRPPAEQVELEEYTGIVNSIKQDAAAAAATSKKASRNSRRRVCKSIEPLACYFCRGRKIACGALPGSRNKSCWQCVKRDMVCVYPTESRRGQRRLSTRRRGSSGAGPSMHVHKARAMARL